MNTRLPFPILISLFLIGFSCSSPEDLKQFAATEVFPDDSLLQEIAAKRAMIVIAHDDDMCAMSGTISSLNKVGWKIAVMSFSKEAERNAAQIEACKDILDTVMFVDMTPQQYRNDLAEGKLPYHAIPKETFNQVFNRSNIENEFVKRIIEFQPTVIFTLDNEIGGYGHPEHVFISQMVIDLATDKKITPLYIYQSVYTDRMETSIMKRHAERLRSWGLPDDEWNQSKSTYHVEGMPEPSVQIDIRDEAKSKMEYLRSYNEREREVLDFFIPEFEKFSAEEYFAIFDREFFRVIKI